LVEAHNSVVKGCDIGIGIFMTKSSQQLKKIVIFGGTGQTGRQLVQQSLSAGYIVRVLARDANKAKKLHANVEVQIGDATDALAVAKALEDQHAVLCAVGGQGLKDASTRTQITQTIISEMQKQSIKKLVVCSVVGIGKSSAHLGWFSRFFSNLILKHAIADHRQQEALITDSQLDYVVFRPPQLIDGEMTREYLLAEEDEPFRATKIRRSDVAHAMIEALKKDEWIGKHFSISS